MKSIHEITENDLADAIAFEIHSEENKNKCTICGEGDDLPQVKCARENCPN